MEQSGREFLWEALEYPHKERSVDWFWGLGLIAIVIAGISIFQGNALFAVLVITGALAVGVMALRTPKPIIYRINDKFIEIDNKKLWYPDIESFYLSERGDSVKLIIASKHLFSTYIVIPVFDHDGDVLRAFLRRKIPEVPHEEPFLHVLIERLGL